ncbi:MAG: hypothetical protein ACTSYU_05805 [Promethearchaeota archaeon]
MNTVKISFPPQYLPKRVQNLITSTLKEDEGYTVTFSETVDAAELIDIRLSQNTMKPPLTLNGKEVEFEGVMRAWLEKFEKANKRIASLEREIEINTPTHSLIQKPSGLENPYPTRKLSSQSDQTITSEATSYLKSIRIKDHVTPKHMISVSFFMISTLLIGGFFSFKTMTPGNWVGLSILVIDGFTIVGRDPAAFMRMGKFAKNLKAIMDERELDFAAFLSSAVQQMQLKEKGNNKVGFRDFVGPFDMIFLLLATLFVSLITGLLQIDFPSTAFFGILGMFSWGVLSLFGVAQPNIESLLNDMVAMLGINIPFPLTQEQILRAKFIK